MQKKCESGDKKPGRVGFRYDSILCHILDDTTKCSVCKRCSGCGQWFFPGIFTYRRHPEWRAQPVVEGSSHYDLMKISRLRYASLGMMIREESARNDEREIALRL